MSHSKPLRENKHPMDIPTDEGKLPLKEARANRALDLVIAAARIVISRGKFFLAESPPGRGEHSRFPMVGREDHAGQFEDPRFLALVQEHGMLSIFFDQCMTRNQGVRASDVSQKKTQLIASRDLYPHVHRRFAPLVCNCSETHASMTSKML